MWRRAAVVPSSDFTASSRPAKMFVWPTGWIPAIVQVQRDFQDKLGLAIGIVSAGVGVVEIRTWLTLSGEPLVGTSHRSAHDAPERGVKRTT